MPRPWERYRDAPAARRRGARRQRGGSEWIHTADAGGAGAQRDGGEAAARQGRARRRGLPSRRVPVARGDAREERPQRADGGWAQRAELDSDAYATGQTLFALCSAIGLAESDAAYQRGVKFLLSTQRDDGSWYVRSRAVKFQPFFESGFPYGHDQWISSMATGWATAALAYAMPGRPATHVER